MNVHVETERFLLRDIEPYDVEGMFDLDADPEVHQFLGNKPISSIDEARAVIEHVRAQYVKYGIGRWAIEDKKTKEFIGWTGLKYEQKIRDGIHYYDLGYRLRRKFWGLGIATETAIGSLNYGFEHLDLKEIGAAAHVDHIASNKILKKTGFNLIETFHFDGALHNWYTLKKSDWAKNHNRR